MRTSTFLFALLAIFCVVRAQDDNAEKPTLDTSQVEIPTKIIEPDNPKTSTKPLPSADESQIEIPHSTAVRTDGEREIRLEHLTTGYIVHVDFKDTTKTLTLDEEKKPPKISLALYTSDSFVVGNTLITEKVNVDDFKSKKEGTDVNADVAFPEYQVAGKYSSLPITLDSEHWKLNDADREVIIADKCTAPGTTLCADLDGGYGLLGMGKVPKANAEADHATKSFSLRRAETGEDFTLMFNHEIKNHGEPTVLEAGDNFRITGITEMSINDVKTSDLSLKAIFDLNTAVTALPKAYYKQITKDLQDNHGLTECAMVDRDMVCKNTKNYDDLAKFPTITFAGGNNKIKLTPKTYLDWVDTEKKTVRLNLIGVSSTEEEKPMNFVTEKFDNTIILGSEFMREYITLFTFAGNKISLYALKDKVIVNPDTKPNTDTTPNTPVEAVRTEAAAVKDVTLTPITNGYIAHVDFKDKTFNPSADEAKKLPQIGIALYTSDSFVVANTLIVEKVDADKFPSKKTDPKADVTFPEYQVQGKYSTIPLFLDYNYWKVTDPSEEVILADKCVGPTSDQCAQNDAGYGLLGMGKVPKANSEGEKKTKSFSLKKHANSDNFSLKFNQEITEFKNPIVLKTNANWNVPGITEITVDKLKIPTPDLKAIFDLNSKQTSIPKAHFDKIAEDLKNTHGLTECALNDIAEMICKNSHNHKELDKFPTISLIDGVNTLQLIPRTYLDWKAEDKSTVRLNLKGTKSDEKTAFTHVTAAYDNTVIFGSEFLAEYITLFTFEGSTISLYDVFAKNGDQTINGGTNNQQGGSKTDGKTNTNESTNTPPKGPDHTARNIIIIVIVLIIVAVAGYFGYTKWRANKLANSLDGKSDNYVALPR